MSARITTRRKWAAFSGLCLGFFMIMLDSTIVSVVLPDMVDDFSVSNATGLWVNSSYLFAFAVPLVVTGRLGDRYGRRAVYLTGLVVFTLASVGCALTESFGALVAFRAVQGLGAALLTPQCLTIIRELFARREQAVALALWSAVGGLATVTGPLVGGLLVSLWDWPAVFLINAPVCLIAAATVVAFVPSYPTIRIRFSVVAVFCILLGVLLVLAGVQGTEDGVLADPVVRFALILLGGVAVAGVLYLQRNRGLHAIVPLSLFLNRDFVAGSAGAAFASFCAGTASIPLILTLQGSYGMDAGDAALVLVPMGLASVACTPFVGRTTNRSGPRMTALIGSSLLAGSVLLTSVLILLDAPVWSIAVVFAVFGAANSFVWSPFSLVALISIPDPAVGAASGVFNSVKQIGGVVGSAGTAIVISASSEAWAMAMLCLGGIFAAFTALFLPGRDEIAHFSGKVVHGAGIGKDLGFPTANIVPVAGSPLVEDGVYVGLVSIKEWNLERPALVSVGDNSTFSDRERTIEIHVLDFEGDLYGEDMVVRLARRLRGQKAFSNSEKLSNAMRKDERVARRLIVSGAQWKD